MQKKFILAGVGVLIGLALLSVVAVMVLARNTNLHGTQINPAMVAPAINLPATNGKDFHLSDEKDHVVLMFFGFTNCTDICPATMAQLHQAVSRLGSDANRVQVVFITVDPQRDTLEQMHSYLANFDPSFLGLTGTMDQMSQVWKSYGVYRQVEPNTANPDEYSVDHTSYIFLIDQKGNLRLTYDQGTSTEDISQDLQSLLN